MDQAVAHSSRVLRNTSSKSDVFNYFRTVLTPDRWTPISSFKVAEEVGISQSTANRAIQLLAADGKILRQFGHGRKDACAYKLTAAPKSKAPELPAPRKPGPHGSIPQAIADMRELEEAMGDMPVAGASFNVLLRERGNLLGLVAALQAGSVSDAVARLGVLFEMVSPDLEAVSTEGKIVQAAMRDFRALCPV